MSLFAVVIVVVVVMVLLHRSRICTAGDKMVQDVRIHQVKESGALLSVGQLYKKKKETESGFWGLYF